MELISDISNFPNDSFVATIGFFDGVHIGHRFLLDQLKQEAAKQKKKSLVISFDTHPKNILSSGRVPSLLTNNQEKKELFEEIGIDACVFLHFDLEMSNLSAYDFLDKILIKRFGVGTLLIGYDNRFGKDRAQGIDDYIEFGNQLGIKVLSVGSYQDDYIHISSTVIRKLLHNGQVGDALKFLTRPYKLSGIIVEGQRVGRKIGYPTANVLVEDFNKLIPGLGVYAVKVVIDEESYKGMLNIGNRPTVSLEENISIEVHILDFDKDIYGKAVDVYFYKKIRDEIKFLSVNDLVAQLSKDKLYVLNLDF